MPVPRILLTIYDDDISFVHGDVNYNSNEFSLARNNRDYYRFNNFGKTLADFCKSRDMHIINGRLFDDTCGNYTCLSNDGKSVVDYFITCKNVFDFVSYFTVGERDESDHYPLICHFSLFKKVMDLIDTSVTVPTFDFVQYHWREQCKSIFLDNFQKFFRSCKNEMVNIIDTNVNEAVNMIISLYQDSAKIMCRKQSPRRRNFNQPPWWDFECDESKIFKYKCLRKFRKTNNQGDYREYIIARNKFKANVLRKKVTV